MRERDLRIEQFRDRAAGLRLGRDLGELVGIDAGDGGGEIERGLRDGEAAVLLLERDRALRLERAVAEPRAVEGEAQRHGEAARVRCGDQLLRVGALLVAEAGVEAVELIGEHARLGGDMALALLAEAFVAGGCGADRHGRSPVTLRGKGPT